MCLAIEEMRKEERMEGRKEANREIALTLIKMGMSIEDIAIVVKTDAKIVKEWIDSAK